MYRILRHLKECIGSHWGHLCKLEEKKKRKDRANNIKPICTDQKNHPDHNTSHQGADEICNRHMCWLERVCVREREGGKRGERGERGVCDVMSKPSPFSKCHHCRAKPTSLMFPNRHTPWSFLLVVDNFIHLLSYENIKEWSKRKALEFCFEYYIFSQ
jgi:hypothetical protein